MNKHFLIDGYNLAHKLSLKITKDNLQQVRDKVQRLVSNYAMRKKCKVTIVFDGKWNLGTVEDYQNIKLVFTPERESADTRIKKIIDETPNKSSLCVVSSDGEILRYAQVSRAQPLRSEAFLSDLNSISTSDKSAANGRATAPVKRERTLSDYKPSGLSLNDIEEWKKLFQ